MIRHNHYYTCHTFHDMFLEFAMCNIYHISNGYLRRFEVYDISLNNGRDHSLAMKCQKSFQRCKNLRET